MALPSSGPLGIGAIRTELGSASGSLRTLSSLAGFSTPDAISEFYGYSAATNVYISYYYPNYMTCYNVYTFSATSSAVLATSLTIYMSWFGDLGGFYQAIYTFNSGTACASTDINTGPNVSCSGEFVSSVQYGFTCGACSCCPSQYGSQIYGDPNTSPTGGAVYYNILPCA
jgi:hypothetical protein